MSVPSLSHKDDYFETPDWLFKFIEIETGLKFKIDICADTYNKKCDMYLPESDNALEFDFGHSKLPIWCNPPRSKNGKFVNKVVEQWNKHNVDIVMLLCWNDLGNKYGEKLIPHILNGDIIIGNLGKVKFYKDGVESQYVSRLTYFWAWFKSK